MDAQIPPAKMARFSDDGIVLFFTQYFSFLLNLFQYFCFFPLMPFVSIWWWVGTLSMAAPSVGLGLGLGSGLGSGKSAFTFLQLQELEHQALIFKYMVAGVPVPYHLVLPIWKSVVSSAGGIYKHFPSCKWYALSSPFLFFLLLLFLVWFTVYLLPLWYISSSIDLVFLSLGFFFFHLGFYFLLVCMFGFVLVTWVFYFPAFVGLELFWWHWVFIFLLFVCLDLFWWHGGVFYFSF